MIKSVKKAADILTIVAGCRGSISLEEIARETCINKSTCAHILETLCEVGFIVHPSRRAGYHLGPFVYYLTQNSRFRQDLIQVCAPIMNWLHKRTGETVLLSVMHEEYKLIVHRVEGRRALSDTNSTMIKGIVYPTATGRMMLAHMDEPALKSIFERLGLPDEKDWKGITSFDKLKKALQQIREDGYVRVVDHDVVGYSCEIHNCTGMAGALGMAVPELLKDDTQLIHDLKKAAREINRRLAFDEWDKKNDNGQT